MKTIYMDHHGVISNCLVYGEHDLFYNNNIKYSKTNLRYTKKLLSISKRNNIKLVSISSYNFYNSCLILSYKEMKLDYITVIPFNSLNIKEDENLMSNLLDYLNKNKKEDYLILDDHFKLYKKSDLNNLILIDRMSGLNKKNFRMLIKKMRDRGWIT